MAYEHLTGNTICWCGHSRRSHYWWNKEAEEVCCEGAISPDGTPGCNCAEYFPASAFSTMTARERALTVEMQRKKGITR